MNKTLVAIVVIVILIIGGWAIYQNQNKVPDTGEPIKIGVIGPFTGPVADYGEEIKKGVDAAKVDGVNFIFEDDKCEPAPAVSSFKKLTEFDGVKFIIGPGCGSPQEAIAPLLKDDGKAVVVVPSAASRGLYDLSGGNLFNVQYALEDESAYLAKEMAAEGYKNVAIVGYQNAFSKTHVESFKKNFTGTIVKELWFTDITTDVQSEVLKLKTVKPDAIFVSDISFFFSNGLDRLKQYGITAPVYSHYVVELPAVRKLVEGVTYSYPAGLEDSGEGAMFLLSKESATILGQAAVACNGEVACVLKKLEASGNFDKTGVSQRGFSLKQIKDGEVKLLQ